MHSKNRYLISSDISLDCAEQRLFKDKKEVQLPELSFKVLKALMHSHPNHVSFDQLMDQAWQSQTVSQETVTQRIAMIRKALGQNDRKRYILSIRNKGYRWGPEVFKNSGKSIGHSKGMKTILASCLVLVVSVIFWHFNSDQMHNEATPKTSAQVSSTDMVKQAQFYLAKHNEKSIQIAVDLFRKSLDQSPDQIPALIGLSRALSHQVTKFNQPHSLLTEARTLAEKAIQLDVSYAGSWAALAFVDDASGQIDLAVSGYEKALKLAPYDPSTASSLAYLYMIKGHLLEAMKLNLSVVDSQQLYLNLQIAQTLELLGMQVLAELWYEKADVLSPDNVFTTNLRAQFYLANNQVEKAQKLLAHGISKGIKRPELSILQGMIHWKNQDLNSAKSSLIQASQIDDNNIEAKALLFALELNTKTNEVTVDSFINQWMQQPFTWPDQWIIRAAIYAQDNKPLLAFSDLTMAIESGYRNHRWLQFSPLFDTLKDHPNWLQTIVAIQSHVTNQRSQMLNATWLPEGFLDPQSLQ